jgi:hypothetical protein
MKANRESVKAARDKKNKDDCIYIYEEGEVCGTDIKAYKEGIPTPEYVQWLENYTDELYRRIYYSDIDATRR